MKVLENNKDEIIASLRKTLSKCFDLGLSNEKISSIIKTNYGATPDEYYLINFWDMLEGHPMVNLFTLKFYDETDFDDTIKHFEKKEDYEKCKLILDSKKKQLDENI
jgi:hypothetical protein